MNRNAKWISAVGAALLIALHAAPSAAHTSREEVVRYPYPVPFPILSGVVLPPDAQIALLSGALASPIDPANTGTMAAFGDTRTQTINIFRQIEATLAKMGYEMKDVVKLTVFLVGDEKLGGKMDFAGFNEGYRQFFGTPENPNLVARSTLQISALASPFHLVEIEAIAAKPRAVAKAKR